MFSFFFFTHKTSQCLLSQSQLMGYIAYVVFKWLILYNFRFWIWKSNHGSLPLSIVFLIYQFVQEVEMLVNILKQLSRLGAVQAEQNLWFSIRMKWSWSTFWWVNIMRGWPGQSVRWRCWGEEGRGAREAEKETGSVEKGVAERKGHRVIDGPHTHHDVRSEVVGKGVILCMSE